MWADLGYFSSQKRGHFVINGVTGPDEYSTVVDNNAYTNLMARQNLRSAIEAVEWLAASEPDAHARLIDRTKLHNGEVEDWRRAADLMYVPYDDAKELHLQDDGFLDREVWDFEGTPPENYPLLLHYHPLVIYRHQVIKQADIVLATFLVGDEFTPAEKRKIFAYYDPLTTGDSSLSECIQSIVAAEIGDVRAAEEYFIDAAAVDLADVANNVRDGVHVASAGGTWLAAVYGFAGLRDGGAELSFRPLLPERLTGPRLHAAHPRVRPGRRAARRGRHLPTAGGRPAADPPSRRADRRDPGGHLPPARCAGRRHHRQVRLSRLPLIATRGTVVRYETIPSRNVMRRTQRWHRRW